MEDIQLRYITEGITGEEAAEIIHGNDEALREGANRLAEKKLDKASYTAADVLAKLLTVDGPGSELNADNVDGLHVWAGTKEEFEALPDKDDDTIYVIRGEATYFEILQEAKFYTDERETAIRADFTSADKELRTAIEAEAERAAAEEKVIRAELATADTAILATVRGGADEGYNTLRKLQTYIEAINRAISGTDTPDVIDTLNEALAFIREHQGEIESLVNTYIKKSAIADDLTTDDAAHVLSARQGRELAQQIKGVSDSLGTKLEASAYTAADVLAKLLTVDGHGSGLETDAVANQKSGAALKIWQGSEAEYTAIANKDANILYIVL